MPLHAASHDAPTPPQGIAVFLQGSCPIPASLPIQIEKAWFFLLFRPRGFPGDQTEAVWKLKGGLGEPKAAQKSALGGLGDRLVGVLGASGGTRPVLLQKGLKKILLI